MTPIERMLIEHECARLQTRYTLCADRGDVEGFVALFAPDGSVQVPDYPAFVGHDAIRTSMQGLAALAVSMRHLCTNSFIEVDSPDRAHGWCYLVTYNSGAAPDASGARPVEPPGTVGEYRDEFVRRPDGWRFRARVLTRVFRRTDDAVRQAAEARTRGAD